MAMFQTAFPDMHATVEDVIAEGEQVVTRVTLRGTHPRRDGVVRPSD